MYGRPTTALTAGRPSTSKPTESPWGARPPPTATRTGAAVVPPTARLATTRPTTAMRARGGEFSILNRPMTQQGLGGIKTGAQGLGRMVMDRTYFLSELRQKINLLVAELKRVAAEAEAAERESSNYHTFERRADALSKELREAQDQLGDLNTLLDKLHIDSDLEDIERQHAQIKAQNQRESHNVDDVFLQKQQKENAVRDIERQVAEEKQKAESRINNLEPEKQQEYHDLQAQNDDRLAEIARRQAEMDELGAKLKSLRELIEKQPAKQKAFQLRMELMSLKARKNEQDDIAKEAAAAELKAPEERERLLAKVKDDNQEIAGMERKLAEVEDQARKLREQISQIDSDLEAHHGERNAKYEELMKRDKDMQTYIDGFEDRKAESVRRNAEVKVAIVDHLERIKSLSWQTSGQGKAMPSAEEYSKLKGDLQLKEREMANSQSTVEALAAERDRRLADLDKVRQLESKLSSELAHLRKRIASLTTDLERVNNLEEAKRAAEARRARSAAEKAKLAACRDHLKNAIREMSARYDGKKSQLNENETASHLNTLEQRLRAQEGTNFHFKEFILDKKSESNYGPVAREAAQLVDECNSQLLKLVTMLPPR